MSIVFLGTEASAAGYRLAGIDARSVDAGNTSAAFAAARDGTDLVIVEASVASGLDPAQWRDALAAEAPLVVVVPDIAGAAQMPDLAARLRKQLGLGDDE